MHVTSICRAFVDLVTHVSERELEEIGFGRTADALIPKERLQEVFAAFRARGALLPGGPGANTMAGIAALGGRAAFIGAIGDDDAGNAFAADFVRRGVHFSAAPVAGGASGLCLIFVAPDGDRSVMVYNKGVADELRAEDMDRNREALEQTRVLYLGIPLRVPGCDAALARARHIAPGATTATSLQSWKSGPDAPELARRVMACDIVMGNEDEWAAFARALGYPDADAVGRAHPAKILARTLAEKGAHIYADGARIDVPARPVAQVKDATGAGDAFAAGFLYGIAEGFSLRESAEAGASCAAQILGEAGGRPQGSWAGIVKP